MNEPCSIKTERKSNFELLRIVAMLLIIAHHLSVHGVMHYKTTEQFIRWTEGTLINRVASCLLFPGGEVGVAIFFYYNRVFQYQQS